MMLVGRLSKGYNTPMEYLDLLRTLPPLVAALAWDCINNHVTSETIKLAQAASDQEYKDYALVRMLAAGNIMFPEILADEGCNILDFMKVKTP
jgi:hypothetical protein